MAKRRQKPPEGWTLEVKVLCDAQQAADLHACALPNEAAAHTYLRIAAERAAEQGLTADILLRYRKMPLFPDWLRRGPLTAVQADRRGRHLLTQGFEVKVEQIEVEPKPPPIPDEDVPEHCDECGAELNPNGRCPTPEEH